MAIALAGSALFVGVASASISPKLTLTQTGTGFTTQAGANPTSLGFNISFNATSGDSAKDFTLELPPGLLASAAIDNGACLKSTALTTACQIGTAELDGALAENMYLVQPPASGDFAGVAIGQAGGAALATAAVSIRPVSSPLGSGLNLTVSNLPASPPLDTLAATFTDVRLPDSCPSTPANVTLVADSQQDPTTKTATAPLQVTGCASLAGSYAPAYALTVQKDPSDAGVAVTTSISETATEETSKVVQLDIPSNIQPNLTTAASEICSNANLSACTAVGTATAVSPLLPGNVPGTVYLTGSLLSPQLTLDFPQINLELNGAVSLSTESVTFDNVPDIPLTALVVTLSGGSHAVFETGCSPASATATATFTDQNGDKTVTDHAPFTITGCQAPPPPPKKVVGKPRVIGRALLAIASGHPRLFLRLVAGKNAPKISSVTIHLAKGMRFLKARLRKGVTVAGAKIKAKRLFRGGLVIVLRKPVGRLVIRVKGGTIAVTRFLRLRAKHHRIKVLRITLLVRNAKHKPTRLTVAFKHPR